MIAVDTNMLARFHVDDSNDPEAAVQRPIGRRVVAESAEDFVPLTVILELEWVLRAFYRQRDAKAGSRNGAADGNQRQRDVGRGSVRQGRATAAL